LPGSGKTTLARQLAVDRSAVCLTKDEWHWALGASPWDERTNAKVERQLWRIAKDSPLLVGPATRGALAG
jgi:predicted kinase